jgi:hypothetical protein
MVDLLCSSAAEGCGPELLRLRMLPKVRRLGALFRNAPDSRRACDLLQVEEADKPSSTKGRQQNSSMPAKVTGQP